jgi:hypothetical protein
LKGSGCRPGQVAHLDIALGHPAVLGRLDPGVVEIDLGLLEIAARLLDLTFELFDLRLRLGDVLLYQLGLRELRLRLLQLTLCPLEACIRGVAVRLRGGKIVHRMLTVVLALSLELPVPEIERHLA